MAVLEEGSRVTADITDLALTEDPRQMSQSTVNDRRLCLERNSKGKTTIAASVVWKVKMLYVQKL